MVQGSVENQWGYFGSIYSVGVAERHLYPKPHANLEEVQRGVIYTIIKTRPPMGDFYNHVDKEEGVSKVKRPLVKVTNCKKPNGLKAQ